MVVEKIKVEKKPKLFLYFIYKWKQHHLFAQTGQSPVIMQLVS